MIRINSLWTGGLFGALILLAAIVTGGLRAAALIDTRTNILQADAAGRAQVIGNDLRRLTLLAEHLAEAADDFDKEAEGQRVVAALLRPQMLEIELHDSADNLIYRSRPGLETRLPFLEARIRARSLRKAVLSDLEQIGDRTFIAIIAPVLRGGSVAGTVSLYVGVEVLSRLIGLSGFANEHHWVLIDNRGIVVAHDLRTGTQIATEFSRAFSTWTDTDEPEWGVEPSQARVITVRQRITQGGWWITVSALRDKVIVDAVLVLVFDLGIALITLLIVAGALVSLARD